MISTEARVAMGLSCHDCDPIPKVAGAGGFKAEADGTRIQIMHNGLKVLAGGYYGDWMAELIQGLQGHHEPQEERLFHELVGLLPVDGTMIELGGFWSYYTLWFLKNCPHRRAVVLEADPAHLAIGRTNAELNRLTPTFVHGVAAETDAPPAPFQTEVSGMRDLPRLSVPGLMKAHGLERLDLLHCDTQGAEYAVLRGCLPLIEAGSINWICISTHHHRISGDPLTHQRCLALLRRAGAVVEAEHDVQESFSGDGLILARCGAPQTGWHAPDLSLNRVSTSLFRDPLYDLAELQPRGQCS
jgi:FkbM family methyltransferase